MTALVSVSIAQPRAMIEKRSFTMMRKWMIISAGTMLFTVAAYFANTVAQQAVVLIGALTASVVLIAVTLLNK
jgi:hypothetical protein